MRAFSLCLAFALLLPQCGGSGGGADPKTAADEEHDASERSSASSASADSEADSAEAGPAESAPRGPSCDDGTCSVCGSGMCPTGWYCDESAPGGPACSWLTECAEKPSCSCVTKVLGSSCKCREDAGIKVSCN